MRRSCFVNGTGLLVAVMSLGLFAADDTWTGIVSSDWYEPGNWIKEVVPGSGADALDSYYITVQSEGNHPLAISEGMDLQMQMLRTTYSDGVSGEINITGGSVRLLRNDVNAFTLGYSSFNPADKPDWGVCRISGGSLTGTGSNTGMIIGRWSRGRLIQTGGDIIFPGSIYMAEQSGDTHEGEYLMSGGTLSQTNNASVMRMGISDSSAWRLSGNAVATLGSVLEIGYGEGVTLGGNARLTLSRICGAGNGRSESTFVFDGGTLALKSGVPLAMDFISDMATLAVADGGAVIEIPAGATACLCQPMTAQTGSAGGLVKKGGGLLFLAAGNTYAGATVVEAGVLAVPDKINVATLSIAEGANVMIDSSQYTEAELSAILSKAQAAGNESYLPLTLFNLGDDEVRTVSADLDFGAAGLTLYGNGTLVLTGNNHWTGETRVAGGTLAAKRGAGLPAESKLVLSGGSWAPLDGEATVAVAESETFAVDGAAPLGLAAVTQAEKVEIPVKPTMMLNDKGDRVLTVANDLTLDSETTFDVRGSSQGAKTVLAGSLSSSAKQTVTGRGALEVSNRWEHTAGDFFLANGEFTLSSGASFSSTPAVMLYSAEGTTVNIESGANFQGVNDIRIGDGANQRGTVNVMNGGSFGTSGYMHVGRRNTATGTLNVEGGTVNAGTMIVGEGQSTGTLNMRGGSVTAGKFEMGNTRNEANGGGLATFNLDAGRFEVTSADPCIGRWGTAVVNMTGGELEFPNKYAYIGTYGKAATFNQSGGKAVYNNRLYLAHTTDANPATAVVEYSLSGGEAEMKGDLRVGNYGRATFNMTDGTLSVGGYLHVGVDSDPVKGNGNGTVNFLGGTANINNRTQIGTTASGVGVINADMQQNGTLTFKGRVEIGASGTGTFNLKSGALTFNGDVDVGSSGTGTFNLKSGTATQTGGWLYVSRENGSRGELNITGGVYDYQTGNGIVSIGTRSDGVLNISGGTLKVGNGARMELGYHNPDPGYVGHGTINLSGDGVIEATRIHAGNGPGTGILNVDGGTLRASETAGDFLENIELNLGAGGLTLDSNGHDVSAAGAVVFGASAGSVRKVGAGTFAVHDFPMAKTSVTVEEGTLRVVPQNLRHRWSFNGDFRDAVSGAEASLINNANFTADGKALAMAGDTKVDLGRNILPVNRDATIEMWVTRKDKGTWEKLLTLGNGKNDVVCFGSQNNNTDEMVVVYTDTNTEGGSFASGNTSGLGTLTIGEKRHLSITFKRVSENETRVTCRQKNMNGATIGTVTLNPTGTLGTLAQNNCFLGQNPWNNPSTVCDVDEVRVWDVAMSDEELSASVQRGPDVLPPSQAVSSADATVLVPENPAPELVARNYLLHRWTFDGTLNDEVTGNAPKASAGTAFTEDGKALSLAGGAKLVNYVNLGSNLLPRDDTPMTIEMWATDQEYRQWAKAFSFGAGKNDLISLNTNSGSEDAPGYLTLVSSDFGHGTENMNLSTNRFGERLYYGIVMVPNGEKLDVTLRVKDPATGRTLESVEQSVWWKPSLSAQNDFYLGVSYWSNVGPRMDYEEIRFWNAALSDAQQTANVLRGPDVLPETFDSVPLKVEVAEGATLDLGNRPLTLHNVDAAGALAKADLTVDGVLSPGGDDAVGTLDVDGSLKVTGVLRLNLGDTIQLTGDLDLSEATIEVMATDDEVLEYMRLNGKWVIAGTTDGRIVTQGLTYPLRSMRWKNTGKELSVSKPNFIIYIR